MMERLKVFYFPDAIDGPVREQLDSLKGCRPGAWAKLVVDIETLSVEGPRTKRANVRPLGSGLWELKRRFDGIQYRLFFCVHERAIWLLHMIEKKSAKTPRDDLRLADRRYRTLLS